MNDHPLSRRTLLKRGAILATAAIGGVPVLSHAQDKVKIGFLTALTGIETIMGEIQSNCFRLAVDEINQQGGAGGRPIEFLVADDESTTKGTIDKTRKLLFEHQVDAIIGMISSVEQAAARAVTGPAKKLLMYTCYYEGGVCDRYFAATGQIPNQQIDPTSQWITQNIGKSVYVIGSDYAWPRRSAEAIRTAFEANGGKLLGAEFFPFGTQDFSPAFEHVKAARPDIVWLMVAGPDAVTILKQYRNFDLKPRLVSNGWDEVYSFRHPKLAEGLLSNQAYFMGIDTPRNRAFVQRYQKAFGTKQPINAIGEATYDAVWLYARAVARAGTTDTEQVIQALGDVDFEAPQGHVNFDPRNHQMACNSILARARADGMWETVEDFGQIQPRTPGCNLA